MSTIPWLDFGGPLQVKKAYDNWSMRLALLH